MLSGFVIPACWFIFLLYWIISIRGVKPVAERQHLLAFLTHRLPTWLGAWLLFWPRRVPFALGRTVTPLAARDIAFIFPIAGLAVAIWARRTLAGNWSGNITFKQNHELIQTGPYRYVRHPIYTGILLMAFGTALARASLAAWLGFVLMTTGFFIKLKYEETLMLRHFPDTYLNYKKHVKALIPFVL